MRKGKRVRVSKGNVGRGRKKEKVRERGFFVEFFIKTCSGRKLVFPAKEVAR